MIYFKIERGQELVRVDNDVVAADTTDLMAHFDLDELFTGGITSYWRSDTMQKPIAVVLNSSGECLVPYEVLAKVDNKYGVFDHYVFVSIADSGMTTSSTCVIKVQLSQYSNDPENPGEPTPTIIEQLTETVASANAYTDEKVGEANQEISRLSESITEISDDVTELYDNIDFGNYVKTGEFIEKDGTYGRYASITLIDKLPVEKYKRLLLTNASTIGTAGTVGFKKDGSYYGTFSTTTNINVVDEKFTIPEDVYFISFNTTSELSSVSVSGMTIGDFTSEEIEKLKPYTENVETIYYQKTGRGSTLDSSIQWLMTSKRYVIGDVINVIEADTSAEDGELVRCTFNLYDENTRSIYLSIEETTKAVNKKATFNVNYNVEHSGYMSVVPMTDNLLYVLSEDKDLTDLPRNQTTYSSLSGSMLHGFSAKIYKSKPFIEEIKEKLFDETRNNGIIIHVGAECKYTEIQDALDSTDVDCLTIIVHPKETPYKRFSLMRKLSEPYPWRGIMMRHISIIGIDKDKCIVRDDSGNYNTPPAEIATNGVIKNLRFIATHDESTEDFQDASYAVHIDCRPLDVNGYNLTFDNCDFVSMQTASVGIGIYRNQHLHFVNCNFLSEADVNYKPNNEYHTYFAEIGAFFSHTSMGEAEGNEVISLKNCNIISTLDTRSLKIENSDSDTNSFELEAIGNTLWSYGSNSTGYQKSGTIKMKPYNHGNNDSRLQTI